MIECRARDAPGRCERGARRGAGRSGGGAGGRRAITASLAGGAGRGRPSPAPARGALPPPRAQSAPCCRRARTRMSFVVESGDVRWPPPLPQRRAIDALVSRKSAPGEGSRAFEPARRRPPWI